MPRGGGKNKKAGLLLAQTSLDAVAVAASSASALARIAARRDGEGRAVGAFLVGGE